MQSEKSPNVSNFRQKFAPRNAPNFPLIFRGLPRFVPGKWRPNAKSPDKLQENVLKTSLESRQSNKHDVLEPSKQALLGIT